MNTSQARDMVRTYLGLAGDMVKQSGLKTLIDNILNVETQRHFERTKALKGYWHSLVTDKQNKYNMPDACINIDYLKISNETYYPAPWPYIDQAKRDFGGRTRVNDDGTNVANVADRWYWIDGSKIIVYPAPQEDTGTETSGACTVSGSTVTISTGSLGDDNSLIDRLILVGSTYYNILSHDSSAIVVEGTPASGSVTYTIYEYGLQIWGVRRPTALTIGGTDDIPGTDTDAMAIVLRTAIMISMTKPDLKVNTQGLEGLYRDYFRQADQSNKNKEYAPISITPFTLRSDHAGQYD